MDWSDLEDEATSLNRPLCNLSLQLMVDQIWQEHVLYCKRQYPHDQLGVVEVWLVQSTLVSQ